MAWYNLPAWLASSKDAVDGYRADMRRSARRPLGTGERLLLVGGALAALFFAGNIAWRLLG